MFKLNLNAGFGIYLKACISLIFTKKCWTLVRKEWKFPLWSKTIGKPRELPTAATPAGEVNLDVVNEAPVSDDVGGDVVPQGKKREIGSILAGAILTGRILRISENKLGKRNVEFFPNGATSLQFSRPLAKQRPVTFSGTIRNPITMELRDLTDRVILNKATTTTTVVIPQSGSVSSYATTSNGITTETGFSVTDISALAQLIFSEPFWGKKFSLNGIPCPTTINIQSATARFTGSPSLYAGKPITLVGSASEIYSQLSAKSYTISQNVISAGEFTLNLPNIANYIEVSGLPSGTNFLLSQLADARDLILHGGPGDDILDIPDLAALAGRTFANLGAGTNILNANANADSGDTLTVAPSFVQQKRADGLSLASFANILQHNVVFRGKTSGKSTLNVLPPISNSELRLTARGVAATSKMDTRISGCQGKSSLRLNVDGPGDHTVYIGDSVSQISTFQCTVWITRNVDPQVASTLNIVVDATSDEKWLRWNFDTSGSLTIHDVRNVNNWFLLIYTGVDRMTVSLGKGGSYVEFAHGSPPTEFWLKFPMNSSLPNSIYMWEATNPMLLSGNVGTVRIGGPSGSGLDPMDSIFAMGTFQPTCLFSFFLLSFSPSLLFLSFSSPFSFSFTFHQRK